ncbi:MAG: peroxidase family protein, partial [Chloroflexota bacterium]
MTNQPDKPPTRQALAETVEVERGRHSRRDFLKETGAGVLGTALLGPGLAGMDAPAAEAAHDRPGSGIRESDSAHFGRMFGNLPFFGTGMPAPALVDALLDIGKPEGLMDAQDDLSAGPVALLTDPALSANNPDNPTHTAGTHFFGQFLDHDITFDVSSSLASPTDPLTSPNGRTPAFDLDSVYGGGPAVSPQLYDPTGTTFRLESGGLHEDVQRTAGNVAIIPEPRNDENLIVGGLECAVMLFHNHVVASLQAGPRHAPRDLFARARRLTTWHYQWLILHEFLPLFVGQTTIDEVLTNGRQYYLPRRHVPFIPVEFQSAAYRMGHSMVRPSYRANFTGDNGLPFFAMVFDPSQFDSSADPDDLSGGRRAPRRFVGWHTFYDFGDGLVKPNKKIDTKISSPLFHLPLRAIPPQTPPAALAQRTLLRHITWLLPSGQAIAAAMGAPVIGAADLQELAAYGLGLETSTPLWYYILK